MTYNRVRRRENARAALLNACVETLESRMHLSASKFAVTSVEIAHASSAKPAGSTVVPSGALTPSQVSNAYGIPSIVLPNVTTANGAGQTIAIIDAYNDPNALSDLQAFDAQFGLANPPSFKVENETGGSSLPATDTETKPDTWELEESLDIEWAHAIAPGANIILFEASSTSFSDLFTAVNTAKNTAGVSAVSMSWSTGGDFSGENSYDSYFTSNAGHGVTFLAATGDSGGTPGYPAISPNVIGVGGTSLDTNSAGAYLGESAWSGSSGGLSTLEAQPTYQKGIVTQSTTQRGAPDVSMDADPNTGVAVYDSFDGSTTGGNWFQVGGTSLATPMWAGLISIVNQGRVANGLGTYDGATGTLPRLYALPSSDFNDIISGSNNSNSAGPGYDLVTGRGSPIANLLVPALANIPVTTIPSAPTGLGASGGVRQVSLSWTAVSGATSYDIYRGTASGQETLLTTGVGTNSYSDTGLSNGSTYFYEVTAVNSAGQSGVSNESFTTTTALPATPTLVKATGGVGQINVTWNAVNGATSYNIYRSTVSGGETLYSSSATNSFTDSGLSASSTYYYTVAAVNGAGAGAPSAETFASTSALPAQVTGVIATGGVKQISLTWTAVTGALSYNVYRSTISGGETLWASGVGTNSFLDSGLANGAKYYYTVAAVNNAGIGAASSEVSATTGSLPVQVTGVIPTGGVRQVALTWTAVSSATYNIYRSTVTGGETLYSSSTTNSFTDTGLANGTTYFYQVTAVNAVGEGAKSTEASATTTALPAAPAITSATGGSGSVALVWSTVSGASSYTLYRSTTSGGEVQVFTGISTAGYTNTGLSASTKYFYKVAAVNAAGTGAQSAEASATTTASTAVPSPWKDGDIGGPGDAGSATYNGGTFTINGGGTDIWNTSDQFNYVSQSVTGNATIICRVDSITNTNVWAKAGVMFRTSTAANSAFVDMVVTPGAGVSFQYRSSTGGSSSDSQKTGITAPQWVKLVRSGNTFTGYYSSNGTTWTQYASKSVNMGTGAITAGLCVCAHNNAALATAVIDNVTFTPGTAVQTAGIAAPASASSALFAPATGGGLFSESLIQAWEEFLA